MTAPATQAEPLPDRSSPAPEPAANNSAPAPDPDRVSPEVVPAGLSASPPPIGLELPGAPDPSPAPPSSPIELPPAGTLAGLIKREFRGTGVTPEIVQLNSPDDLPAARDLIARHGKTPEQTEGAA